MIEKYPKFTKIDIDLKKMVNEFNYQFEPYSDFNFVSLFSWNTTGTVGFSKLNDNLVIRLPDYLDETEPVYSILGHNKIDESLDILLGITSKISLVPEDTITHIENRNRYQIFESLDNFDYIYDLENLITLSGKQYKDKRNRLNKFISTYGDRTKITHFENLNDIQATQAIGIVDTWLENSVNGTDYGMHETTAIKRVLNDFNNLSLLFTEIKINNQITGFSINEILGSKYAVCHFEKTSMHHAFSNDFLVHAVAMELKKRGVSLVNWEQDLGILGLRQAKESYRPTRKLKKYIITSKEILPV